MAAGTWICGCGARPDGEHCPTCGWARAADGQPDGTARRWAALLPGVVVVLLAVNGIAAARGLDGEVARYREPRFEERGSTIDDVVEVLPNRALPADLGELVPLELAGWERIDVPGLSGSTTADGVAGVFYDDPGDQADEADLLRELGLGRAHGVAYVSETTDDVVGLLVLELGSVADAEQYLDIQRLAVRTDDSVSAADLGFLEGEVAYTYADPDGLSGMEVVFAIDQLVVRMLLGSEGVPDGALLQPMHRTFMERLVP